MVVDVAGAASRSDRCSARIRLIGLWNCGAVVVCRHAEHVALSPAYSGFAEQSTRGSAGHAHGCGDRCPGRAVVPFRSRGFAVASIHAVRCGERHWRCPRFGSPTSILRLSFRRTERSEASRTRRWIFCHCSKWHPSPGSGESYFACSFLRHRSQRCSADRLALRRSESSRRQPAYFLEW